MYKILLVLMFSTNLFASDDYSKSADRDIYAGPSFKIWCSLTQEGLKKVGGKKKLSSGSLILFPKGNGAGHMPVVVAKDLSKEKEVSDLLKELKTLCLEDTKILGNYINQKLNSWVSDKVLLISLRSFDEVLWEYYEGQFKEDKKKNVCQIRKAFNVKKSWVVTYPELNKHCL